MADQKPMRFRRTALEWLTGIVLGVAGASVWGPLAISWWYKPPSADAFNCSGSVQNALGHFVLLQLGCAAAGGFVLWLALFMMRRIWRRRQLARVRPT